MSEKPGTVRTFVGSGARLNDLIFRSELTRAQVATKAGISRDTLHTALNDQLSLKTARKLAGALGIDEEYVLHGVGTAPGQWDPSVDPEIPTSVQGVELEEFVSNMDRIVLTLRNFPGGELGVRIKVGFLNLVEDVARETGNKLPLEYYRIRKEVQDGDR